MGKRILTFLVDTVKFLLGMNKDDNFPFKKREQYEDALNIRHVSQFGDTGRAIQNVLGNTMAFTIPDVVAGNKVFRIYLTSPATPNHYRWNVDDGNNNILTTVNLVTTASNINTTLTNAQAAFTTAMNLVVPAQTFFLGFFVTGANEGYLEFSITTVPGWEYYVISVGADFSNIYVEQEAKDASMVGTPVIIGSYDMLGDLFVYSSTQVNMPETFADIASVADDGTGQYEITTTNPHNFIDQSAITISGVTGVSAPNNLNGYWIISVTSVTTFILLGSQFIGGAVLTNALYTINANGYSEIGVGVQDNNSGAWTYTRLLGTKELNFRIQKQIDVYQERNAFTTSCYFTDDYNPPRVFYYKGLYVTDGAIHILNPDGQYAYGSINQETLLTAIQVGATFTFRQQLQAGGAVLSGNWRYTIRFLTESLIATEWIPLLNPISVFVATDIYSTITDAENLFGNAENVTTGKINEFLIAGIVPGLFKYVELGGVNYLNTTITAQIIKRDLLLGGTTQTIQHLGTETGSIDIDPGTLNFTNASIATAKNINAIDNRLILSNITTSESRDFSAFTKTFFHNVKRTETGNNNEINGIKFRFDGTLTIGEFQIPENVFFKAGYMLNEVYRYGAKFQLKTGELTDVFWIDDIIINDSAVNAGNPFGDNRRISGLPSMDLTDVAENFVYSPYIQFVNIDTSYIIDGVSLSERVDKIIIERVDMNDANREVIGSGIAVQSIKTGAVINTEVEDSTTTVFTREWHLLADSGTFPTATEYIDYFAAAGLRLDNPIGVPVILNPTYPTLNTAPTASIRRCGSVYVPDWLQNFNQWTFVAGDQIISFGSPVVISFGGLTSIEVSGDPLPESCEYRNNIREFTGFTSDSGTSYTVVDMKNIAFNGTASITGTGNTVDYFKPSKWITFFALAPAEFNFASNYSGPVYGIATDIVHSGAGADFGVLQAQVYRKKINKFGDIDLSRFITTGSELDVLGPAVLNVDVFGGDVFTQKTYFLHRWNRNFVPTIGTAFTFGGTTAGMGFYSQNHVNTQMYQKDTTFPYKYPAISEVDWVNSFLLTSTPADYNNGYNIRNEINSDIAFDPNSIRSNDLPTRIYYSDLKPIDSVQDNYRVILPLNFHDLDLSAGEIMHHVNLNGELFTWQVRKLQRQYFNTRGQLQTTNNLSIVIGDGSVLSRDGQTISIIGTTHKWSVIRGKSQGGNDVFYWINTELKKACRIALDGTVSLADIEGMQSFFANNLRWVATHDNPASGSGIAGVWDDRNFEALWTMRGHKDVVAWDSLASYSVGEVVSFVPAVFSTYEQTGEIYISLTNSNLNNNPESSIGFWQLIPHTDNNYYNEYTVAFNEQKNQFTTFYTFKPTIYLKYKDTLLSPDPQAPNTVYIHNVGGYCQWYNGNNEDGHITLVYSGDNNMVKMLHSLLLGVNPAPSRVDIYTQDHHTFMLTNDMEDMNGNWVCGIKNDTLTSATGSTEDDTSKLWGQYALIDVTFQQGILQVMNSVMLKFAPVSRDYRS